MMIKSRFSPMTAFWLYFLSVFIFIGVTFLSGKVFGKVGLFAGEISLVLPLILYFRIQKISIPAGFAMRRTSWRFYMIGLMFTLGFFVIADELNRILNLMRTMDTDLFEGLRGLMIWNSPVEMALLVFGGVVCAPFAEEMVLRGFLQHQLQRTFPPVKTILAVSFCFTFLHFQPWFMLQHFMFSVLMGLLFLRSRSVWPVISAHAVFNLAVLLMNNVESSLLSWYHLNGHITPLVVLGALILLYTGLRWTGSPESSAGET